MSTAWIILLVLSIVLSVALIVFYEIYVYRRRLGWAQIVASLTFLVILGLWLGFAVVYYKDTKKSTKLLCTSTCHPIDDPCSRIVTEDESEVIIF